jgi:hypothetical protein
MKIATQTKQNVDITLQTYIFFALLFMIRNVWLQNMPTSLQNKSNSIKNIHQYLRRLIAKHPALNLEFGKAQLC